MQKICNQACYALTVFTFILLTVSGAKADNFTFTGIFAADNDARFFEFVVADESTIVLRTTSYANDGFDPVLALFDLSRMNGQLLAPAIEQDGLPGDSLLAETLQPGRYIVALTQFVNLATGPDLSDGFLLSDDPFFTRQFAAPGATGMFYDLNGNRRNGNFSLEVLNVASATPVEAAPVPEPATLLLLGTGLAGVASAVRRRQ